MHATAKEGMGVAGLPGPLHVVPVRTELLSSILELRGFLLAHV